MKDIGTAHGIMFSHLLKAIHGLAEIYSLAQISHPFPQWPIMRYLRVKSGSIYRFVSLPYRKESHDFTFTIAPTAPSVENNKRRCPLVA